jgi:hypothetical protein
VFVIRDVPGRGVRCNHMGQECQGGQVRKFQVDSSNSYQNLALILFIPPKYLQGANATKVDHRQARTDDYKDSFCSSFPSLGTKALIRYTRAVQAIPTSGTMFSLDPRRPQTIPSNTHTPTS